MSYAQQTTRAERNYIREGNKLYSDSMYMEAVKAYNKALEDNPTSITAKYNKALSEIQINFSDNEAYTAEEREAALKSAESVMQSISMSKDNPDFAAKANYCLGNVAFNQQQYQQAVDYYKNSLRINPNSESARRNLRIAQKKLQNNNSSESKNDNKNSEDNKQDNQKQKEKQNNQQQENRQNQQQNKQNQQNQQQPPQNDEIKESTADQILKRGEAKEKELRSRAIGNSIGNGVNPDAKGGRSRKNW